MVTVPKPYSKPELQYQAPTYPISTLNRTYTNSKPAASPWENPGSYKKLEASSERGPAASIDASDDRACRGVLVSGLQRCCGISTCMQQTVHEIRVGGTVVLGSCCWELPKVRMLVAVGIAAWLSVCGGAFDKGLLVAAFSKETKLCQARISITRNPRRAPTEAGTAATSPSK